MHSTMISLILLVISSSWINQPIHAFQSPVLRPAVIMNGASPPTATTMTSMQLWGSSNNNNNNKEEEIAKLEEQLKKLKDETVVEEKETQVVAKTKEADDELLSEEELDMGMYLTEQWKEKGTKPTASEEESNGLVGGVVQVVGLLLALAFFSQIPIGQEDLSKYSVGSSGPTTTGTIDLGDLNRARGNGDL